MKGALLLSLLLLLLLLLPMWSVRGRLQQEEPAARVHMLKQADFLCSFSTLPR